MKNSEHRWKTVTFDVKKKLEEQKKTLKKVGERIINSENDAKRKNKNTRYQKKIWSTEEEWFSRGRNPVFLCQKPKKFYLSEVSIGI